MEELKPRNAWGILNADGTIDARAVPTEHIAKLLIMASGLVDPEWAKNSKVVKVEVRRVDWVEEPPKQ